MNSRFDAIAELRVRLKSRGEVEALESVDDDQPWIRLPATGPNGFEVTLEDNLDEWTVYYGLAHDHFDDGEQALDRVALLASGEGRIVETWRGLKWQKTRTEHWDGERWRWVAVNGLLLWPFWRRKRIVIRQNALELRPRVSG